MKVQHWVWAWGLAALCCAVGASAQTSVLERVAGGGKLVIAYREKPNGKDAPKGTAQALWTYLQAQAASC